MSGYRPRLLSVQPGQGQVRMLIRKGEPVRNDRAMTVTMSTASLEHAVDLLDKALAGPVLGMDVARARQARQRDVGARRHGQRQASSHGGQAGAVPADAAAVVQTASRAIVAAAAKRGGPAAA